VNRVTQKAAFFLGKQISTNCFFSKIKNIFLWRRVRFFFFFFFRGNYFFGCFFFFIPKNGKFMWIFFGFFTLLLLLNFGKINFAKFTISQNWEKKKKKKPIYFVWILGGVCGMSLNFIVRLTFL
jgi:hypothetical protein